MSKQREPGWYWVKYGPVEQLAYFADDEWALIGLEETIKDNSQYPLTIIDPRPVKREQLDELERLRELNRLRRDGPESTDPEDIAAHGKRISELEMALDTPTQLIALWGQTDMVAGKMMADAMRKAGASDEVIKAVFDLRDEIRKNGGDVEITRLEL